MAGDVVCRGDEIDRDGGLVNGEAGDLGQDPDQGGGAGLVRARGRRENAQDMQRGAGGGVEIADIVPGGDEIAVGAGQIGDDNGAVGGVKDANAGAARAAVERAGDIFGLPAGIDCDIKNTQEIGVIAAGGPAGGIGDGSASESLSAVPIAEDHAAGVCIGAAGEVLAEKNVQVGVDHQAAGSGDVERGAVGVGDSPVAGVIIGIGHAVDQMPVPNPRALAVIIDNMCLRLFMTCPVTRYNRMGLRQSPIWQA